MDEDGGYTREDLDHLFRTVPSALAFLDREGRVVRVNSRFASLTGKPIEAHAGRTLREIAPQLAAQLAPANRKIIEEGDPVVTIEVQDIGRRADDDGRMHRAHCYPLTSRDGTVRGMSIVIDKIADQGSAPARRQNRAERGEAPSPGDGKALNRAVLNSLQDHVAVVDRAGNILAVNEAWKRFARENGGEAEVLGKGVNYLEVCRHAAGNSDKVAARALEGIQAVLVGSTHNFKMEYLCSSARAERCFVMKVVPLNHREGGAVITHTDITQRKAAEGILAEREQQLRIMADSLPVLIAYVDADQRYQFHNVAYERFFGVSREEIIGHTVSEVLGEAAYAEVRDDIRRALSGEKVEFERALYYKSTGERQVHGLYVPHFGEAGKVLGYFTFIQDITERVQAEEEKRKHGAQLAHMDRVTILAELSASLAHELNQPLTAIMANAQAAQRFLSWEPPELEEVAGALADIVADDMRAGEVIRRVRDLLKNGEPRSEFLQLNVVVEEVARLVKNDALKNRISVQMDLAPDLPAVRGDRIQMQQVLLNLVLNAFDAISSGTSGPREVAIQTSTGEDNSVVVAVRDSGVGASGKTLKHMFQPFFTTKQDGLGMGLAISKSIIENHGGRVWLKRNADRGITVCLALPAVPGSADDDD